MNPLNFEDAKDEFLDGLTAAFGADGDKHVVRLTFKRGGVTR
jgi:hypothetical protein